MFFFVRIQRTFRQLKVATEVAVSGKLARLLEAGALGNPQAPGLHGREANFSRQDDVGRFIEMGPRQLVAALRDAAVSADSPDS